MLPLPFFSNLLYFIFNFTEPQIVAVCHRRWNSTCFSDFQRCERRWQKRHSSKNNLCHTSAVPSAAAPWALPLSNCAACSISKHLTVTMRLECPSPEARIFSILMLGYHPEPSDVENNNNTGLWMWKCHMVLWRWWVNRHGLLMWGSTAECVRGNGVCVRGPEAIGAR